MDTPTAHYRELLKTVFADRDWISTSDVLVPAASQAERLLELGARRVLALGASRGTGPLPDPARIPQIELGSSGPDMMSAIRAAQAAMANLSDDVRRRIDAFDPDGTALVIGNFLSDGRPVAGRRMLGARSESWQRLEDKTLHEVLWAQAGIPHSNACVVESDLDALARAVEEIAAGGDAVLSGDSREGYNGGGSYVRWVRTEAQLEEAADFFGAHCDRVRVMPFLEGLPCSIHGIVFPDDVVALRPCEMLVLRKPDVAQFLYSGTASFWDAPQALKEEMRDVAQRVGNTLRETVGYRGTFTVDGVATAEGFRPTELNPRFGAALNNMTRAWRELPLYLLNVAIAEGLELDYRPRKLEELVLDYIDRQRGGRTAMVLTRKIEETTTRGLCRTVDGWRPAAQGEPTDATYDLGPGPTGGFLRIALDPDRTPRGPSAASRVCEVLRHLDGELNLDLGRLEAAVDGQAPAAPDLD